MKITMWSLLRASVAASLALGAMLSVSPAWAGFQNCPIFFDDDDALSNTYAETRSTFAVRSRRSGGSIVACREADTDCWVYRTSCGFSADDKFNVEDSSGYGHYHLSFVDPAMLECGPPSDPGDGLGAGFKKKVDGQCVYPDWSNEPRALESHDASQWIQIWRGTDESTEKPFRVRSIVVGGDVAIQLWFRTLDGQWHYYPFLPPGFSQFQMPLATDVNVRAADPNGPRPYTINGLTVNFDT